MRLELLAISLLLTVTAARAALYRQDESRSPDGAVVFAISYPPTENRPDTISQLHPSMVEGCFLDQKTGKRIGKSFYLELSDAEDAHPGTYSFDAYNVFDYVWSADSSHVAVIQNMRHFGWIYPFRRGRASFQRLAMPDLVEPLQRRLRGAIRQEGHTSVHANLWQRNHRLVATIAKKAQVSDSGSETENWREHSLRFTIAFDSRGWPTVEASKFRVAGRQ